MFQGDERDSKSCCDRFDSYSSRMNKIIKKILQEIIEWDPWIEQKIDYLEKNKKYIAKEIRDWQKRLKQNKKL